VITVPVIGYLAFHLGAGHVRHRHRKGRRHDRGDDGYTPKWSRG
jgi:hypothetical protein